jgi:hypothetical protein
MIEGFSRRLRRKKTADNHLLSKKIHNQDSATTHVDSPADILRDPIVPERLPTRFGEIPSETIVARRLTFPIVIRASIS